ncbi:MAG: sensor histidine kinase [Deltaproteobacteria bacterium]|nr:sensor histidine kinase [Deltaproteobacteria bacterium]
MRLDRFIRENTEEILSEWESFARTLAPASQKMDVVALRDFAKDMLDAIASDLEQPQTDEQQLQKSRGLSVRAGDSAAGEHGSVRMERGFTIDQIVAEFRALRASVIRLWLQRESTLDAATMADLTRFNEAIDQAVADSVARYREDLDHSKDIFLGILGHDLRNPLGAIMMSAGHLSSTAGHEKAAARVLNSAERMKQIIDDLLDFTRSRLGSGIPIHPAEMNIDDVVGEAVEEIAASNPDSSLHFESSGTLTGWWDGPRITQAISNLVGNAVQHGDRSAPVEVSARADGDKVVIRVHNYGPPIPPRVLDVMFTPMVRGEGRGEGNESSGQGLGLGLYIANEIVVGHKGRIEVESDAESGTTFLVTLPRHQGVPRSEGRDEARP